MKEIFEAVVGVFLLISAMLLSVSIISTSIDARNADATIQAYVTEIEHSNFAKSVLSAVFDQAAEDGFTDVSMVFYEKDDVGAVSHRTVASKADVGDCHRVYMVKMSMNYNYTMDFINRSKTHAIEAYAR